MTVTPPDPVVPAPLPWATVDDAHQQWPDSETIADAKLTDLLAAASVVCARFASASVGADDPAYAQNRMLATVIQARQLWSAYRRDGDVLGFDTYAVRVRALTSDVQGLLRPAYGRPMVG